MGIGSIKGRSTAQTSFAANLFYDFQVPFISDASFRLNYLHSRKVEYFLPENRKGKYYPFIHAISLKAFINQSLSELFYVEEGAGLVAVNDRTFSDTNVWDYGIAFNLLGGIDLRLLNKGFKLGAGIEYGITFNNTTASYFSFHLQSQFYF
ncbi:MAG: hypothetical protein D8M61_08435 [Ignavibacteriae bacterium]|nr:hypothetical protein [Ignavibacteriota bacterium]